MSDVIHLNKDSEKSSSSSIETNKDLIEKDLKSKSASNNQDANIVSSALDVSDEERSIVADSQNESLCSSIVLSSAKEEENRLLPSLEVSQPAEDESELGKKGASPDTESGINLLSAIEEEGRSASSSVSELIDNEDSQNIEEVVEDHSVKELPRGSTLVLQAENDPNHNPDDENKVEEIKNLKTSADSDYQAIFKENQVLRARMKEINEQLHKTENEIEVLQNNLANYETDDQLKNPRLLLNKLTTQEKENEDLKEKLQKQNEMMKSSSEKHLELTEEINRLTAEEEKYRKTLKQKQKEVERLESKVTELASVVRSLSASHVELANENGLTTTPISLDSVGKSRTSLSRESLSPIRQRQQKRSKICTVL